MFYIDDTVGFLKTPAIYFSISRLARFERHSLWYELEQMIDDLYDGDGVKVIGMFYGDVEYKEMQTLFVTGSGSQFPPFPRFSWDRNKTNAYEQIKSRYGHFE